MKRFQGQGNRQVSSADLSNSVVTTVYLPLIDWKIDEQIEVKCSLH